MPKLTRSCGPQHAFTVCGELAIVTCIPQWHLELDAARWIEAAKPICGGDPDNTCARLHAQCLRSLDDIRTGLCERRARPWHAARLNRFENVGAGNPNAPAIRVRLHELRFRGER